MRRMYSENQIGDVAVKQLADKDLKVKTIEQKQANWEVNDVFDEINVPEGITYTKVFGRFEEINGVLYIVHCFKITNNTGSSINVEIKKNIDLPEYIASKIFDFDGKKASESGSSNICSDYAFFGSSSELYQAKIHTFRNTLSANRIELVAVNDYVVPANTTFNISFRSFLTLL